MADSRRIGRPPLPPEERLARQAHVLLTRREAAALADLARREKRSTSAIVRAWIREHLGEYL